MKIRYKNFEIESDRSCFILTEYGILSKGKNKGQEGIIDQIYPATLESTIKHIQERIIKNKPGVIELQYILETLREINKEFIQDIKTLIQNDGK